MAPGVHATDFNSIIAADRQKRKNEALAKQIFGKGRRQSAPAGGISNRKPGSGPSLASRIGVAKRTVSITQKNVQARSSLRPKPPLSNPSSGNVNSEWTHDLHGLNNPRVAQSRGSNISQPRLTKTERLYNAVSSSASSHALNTQFNLIGQGKAAKAMTIKGLAGPYIVMAKNFAQGTTADDIESAMTPVGGVCVSCRIITERPAVIAEIIFESREGADAVVATFNNQNADGNFLHVFHKVGGLSAKTTTPKPVTPLGPRAGRPDSATRSVYGSASDRPAPRGDRRREYESRAEVVDGSYGFVDRMHTDERDDYNDGRRLYSDDIGSRGREERDRANQRGRVFR